MNLKQLESFVQVAELGSFSKAAVVLEIAQPALSRQIRALETELRTTLLTRNGRGVELTEAGRRWFDHCVTILQQVALAQEDMGASRDAPVGRVNIGLPPTIGRQLTLPLIDTFQRRLPQARLAIVEGMSTHVSEWIATGRVDLGLLYNPEAQPSLQITPLLQESLCLVSPATPDAARKPLPLRALADVALVLPERQHVIRRLLDSQATLAGLSLNIAWEVSSIAAIIDLVAAGHGHAVLTASAIQASGQADRLIVRPLVEPTLSSVLCLAVPAHKRPSALVRQSCQVLKELVTRLPQNAAVGSLPG
ncbi:LysR substrate-binding domain-containing protein [Sphaerotilus mobilis]|uniref:LysR family nitrogen assimilation transcriptional regulator n=1 Tax=Sphaerotilus mobilis TaxID=47994 RepID=A0A4Q7LGN1_9BURK|nr:LysR substrate-binding domain-containing protein [Sphaerotilus mobilis]RZS53252.1 LysR family nitrogen assimilation transcriptional regulator [Sphaerotilus mobilis]